MRREKPQESRISPPGVSARRITERFIAALAWSFLTLSLAESSVALEALEGGPGALPEVFSLAVWNAWIYLAVPTAFVLAMALSFLVPEGRLWNSKSRLAVQLVLLAATFASMYGILVIYYPFRGYLPFIAAYVVGALGLASFLVLGGRMPKWMSLVASTALLGGGLALHWVNYRVYFGLYATLHLAIAQAELLLLALGFERLLRHFADRRATRIAGLTALPAVLTAGIAGGLSSGTFDDAEAAFIDATVLGQSRTVFNDYSEGGGAGTLTDPAGVWRFEKLSGMPNMPDSFAIDDYNVLLIASEATRFDMTTMGAPATPSTPNIARRAASALRFENAYAPSSGTLHSTAGLFAMAYPAMISMETWAKVWTGRLHEEEETIAESLAKVGYDTFWVGYNHWFPTSLNGFEQGFASVELVPGNDDKKIADAAIAALSKRAGNPKPFFGFLFFVSPHGPYLDHGYADLPNKRERDRYLQELRFVDEQVERVFEELERDGALDNTVVIYLADHGEEFRDHGGTRHKTTVYCESTHVPLVAWIPGVAPGVIAKPVSTTYVFPWLLAHARSPELRARFEDRAIHVFGPMLKGTDGAVVVELIGRDRMKTALVYENSKINVDLISNRVEVYDLKADPKEKKNLFAKDPALRAEAEARVENYKHLRKIGARYVLDPNKRVDSSPEE